MHRVTGIVLAIGAVSFPLAPAQAEQSGWLSAGLTYTRDLAAQTTLMRGATGSELLSRGGFETGAGVNWSSIDQDGGVSATAQGAFDKGFKADTDIGDLGLSGAWMRAISERWLFRAEASTALYRNEAFRGSGYDRVGVATTFGYFASNASGLDLTLALFGENHDQDADARYRNNRFQAEMIYYLPHDKGGSRWNISAALQRNDASVSQFQYSSLLFGAAWTNWTLGSFTGSASAQWRQDDYDGGGMQPVYIDGGSPQGSPMGMRPSEPLQDFPGMTSPQQRNDTLAWLSLGLSRSINARWSASLSLNAGYYESEPMTSQRWFSDYALILERRFYPPVSGSARGKRQ